MQYFTALFDFLLFWGYKIMNYQRDFRKRFGNINNYNYLCTKNNI